MAATALKKETDSVIPSISGPIYDAQGQDGQVVYLRTRRTERRDE